MTKEEDDLVYEKCFKRIKELDKVSEPEKMLDVKKMVKECLKNIDQWLELKLHFMNNEGTMNSIFTIFTLCKLLEQNYMRGLTRVHSIMEEILLIPRDLVSPEIIKAIIEGKGYENDLICLMEILRS